MDRTTEQVFKVGDRVRTTGRGWLSGYLEVKGVIEEVTRDSVGLPYYEVVLDRGEEVGGGVLEFELDTAPTNAQGPATDERIAELNESLTVTVNPDGATDVDPPHYDFPGGVQVIDITKYLDFLTGNVVKYVSRAGRKGDRLTDLLKARKYLDWAIEKEQSEVND